MALDGFTATAVRKAARFEDLPSSILCMECRTEKPIVEMIVVRVRKEQVYRVRPRCKKCHNERERGHRREWKRDYLRRWRRENRRLNDSYWKDNARVREQNRLNAARRIADPDYRDALAIQRRLRNRDIRVSIDEARQLLEKYGRCYPSRFGLTAAGIRECERIRSRLRYRHSRSGRRMPSGFDIRIMVYEQSEDEPGLIIRPELQPVPYQTASKNLKRMHENRKT